MSNYVINHLRELESEAIFVIREIAAQFENPVLLFSGCLLYTSDAADE